MAELWIPLWLHLTGIQSADATALCRRTPNLTITGGTPVPLQETVKLAVFESFCWPSSFIRITSTLYLPFGQPSGGGENV